jgi:hypothetical protein
MEDRFGEAPKPAREARACAPWINASWVRLVFVGR